MKKIRILTVFGTRPEAIKMAPLLLGMRGRPELEPLCCVTAQHREMLDTVLDIFGILPDFDLNIMQPRQTLAAITTRVLEGLDEVMEQSKPDLVLVHGDTSTTFAAALTAFYHQIRVGHVEAGLRSHDKYSPYPEEMNRLLTSRIAELYFCPTLQNKMNLEAEGIRGGMYVTGNTVIDTVRLVARGDYLFKDTLLRSIDFNARRVILLTAHRRENYGRPLENIFLAVRDLCEKYPDIEVVYPVHPSPVVREAAQAVLGGVARVHLIEPLPVDDNLNLMSRCYLVLTDSGGIQEEAPALGKPVLVLRRETERPEAVAAGTAALAGVEREAVFSMTERLLCDSEAYAGMARAVNPYGDG
ncbi:MAG: UDP-N-acetylglucosamine 2-epimerase (non-hydrolyzing), partial [Clostridia bacterium]|nr:UDP-N-acetylglucosamine 2-epimerase (non-hydrolyzing) [Clostridia bacterium]